MLKVIKYKNHGICMRGGDIKERHNKFLFSFFELKMILTILIKKLTQNLLMKEI